MIAISSGGGSATIINAYDEYGIPATTNAGRFQYTGQSWLPEVGLYYYKARIYSPTLGRFLQTDPIGYGDGINWYAYVGNDPVNKTDPSGLCVVVENPGGGAYPPVNCPSPTTPRATCFGRDCIWAPVWRHLPNPDGGGGGEGGEGEEIVVSARKLLAQNGCPVPESAAGTVAAWADTIGEGADAIAITSATLGLISAPTGAGFVIFEGTALIAGGVGRIAAGVSIVANLIDGNTAGAGKGAVSLIGGSTAGFAAKGLLGRSLSSSRMFKDLSASQQRVTNVVGDGVAAGYGRLIGRIGC